MLHQNDIVAEKETGRQGELKEAPRPGIETDTLRWRVDFSDGVYPPTKYFTNESDLILISCPHSADKQSRFVPEREALKRKKLKRALWFSLLLVGALVVIWRNVTAPRKLDDSLTAERDVIAIGRKINAITASGGAEFTTDELIQKYAQVESLLPEYKSSVERFGDSVKRLPKSQYVDKGMEFHEYLWKMGDVWKREAEVVNRMAALPDEDAKVAFSEKEYIPLVDEENRLIEKGKSLAATFDAMK